MTLTELITNEVPRWRAARLEWLCVNGFNLKHTICCPDLRFRADVLEADSRFGPEIAAQMRDSGDEGYPCSWRELDVNILGRSFVAVLPGCLRPKDLIELLRHFLGVSIVHQKSFECHYRQETNLRSLRPGLLPERTTGYWEFYCVRDVIRAGLVGPRLRCAFCNVRLGRYCVDSTHGKEFCSEDCIKKLQEQRYQSWRKRRAVELKVRREMKWINKGKQLLKQTRQILSRPGTLHEVSQSQRMASQQDGSSPV